MVLISGKTIKTLAIAGVWTYLIAQGFYLGNHWEFVGTWREINTAVTIDGEKIHGGSVKAHWNGGFTVMDKAGKAREINGFQTADVKYEPGAIEWRRYLPPLTVAFVGWILLIITQVRRSRPRRD